EYVERGRVASELAARMAFVRPLRIAERGTGGEDGQSRAAASAATPGTTGPALRTTWPRLLVHARWWVLSAWAVVGALAVLRAARPDSVLRLVIPTRMALRRALAAFPEGAQYHAIVTGDTPLERDMLTVTTEDVARSERRLLPVAAVILFIACGSAAGAALP